MQRERCFMGIQNGFGIFISEFWLSCDNGIQCIAYAVFFELSAYFPAEILLRVPVLGSCTPGRSPHLSEPLWAFVRVLHPSPFRRSYRCKVSTEREKEYNDNACRVGGRLKERDGKLVAHDQSAALSAEREGRRPSLATGLQKIVCRSRGVLACNIPFDLFPPFRFVHWRDIFPAVFRLQFFFLVLFYYSIHAVFIWCSSTSYLRY